MRCEELMKKDVQCCQQNDPVSDVAARMRDCNIGFMPVVDDDHRMVGTITDRDITIRVVANSRPPTTPVKDVVTADTVTCKPTDDLKEAESLMSHHKKSRIVCVDDGGKPVGVISLSDIAKAAQDEASAVLRSVSERELRTKSLNDENRT
jgi:CBS domain-containing protein